MVGSGMEIPHAAVVLSNLQSLLERFTGGVLVLVEGVGGDIERGRGLGMPQQSRYRRNICAVGDEKAGVAVSERMQIQLLRQTVLFDDQLEPPSKSVLPYFFACFLRI